jgi:hypothetical protein
MGLTKVPAEHRLILLCARLQPDNPDRREIDAILRETVDWDILTALCNRHGMMPFLFFSLSRIKTHRAVASHVLAAFKNSYYVNLKRNLLIENEICRLAAAAAENGVSFVPIKGFSLLHTIYPSHGLRMMADVDIFIRKQDFGNIRGVIERLGYCEYGETVDRTGGINYRHMGCFLLTIRAGIRLAIEVHGVLANPRPYEIALPRLWERTREMIINGQKLLFLSEEDSLMSLALHVRSHTRKLSLKFIVDIAELLKKNADRLDWRYIRDSARASRFAASIYLVLYLSGELLDARVPPKILREFRPSYARAVLIRAVANKNTFLDMGKTRGAILRLLIFDRVTDAALYFWKEAVRKKAAKLDLSAARTHSAATNSDETARK